MSEETQTGWWTNAKPILAAIIKSPKFLVFAGGLAGTLALKIGLDPTTIEPWVQQGIDILAGALGAGAAVAGSNAAKSDK